MSEQQELEQERYYKLTQAFMEAMLLGMSTENLQTMRVETGFSQSDLDKMKDQYDAI